MHPLTPPPNPPHDERPAEDHPLSAESDSEVERTATGHFPWNEEMDEDLIRWWRGNPILYNHHLEDYAIRLKKDRMLELKAKMIGKGCVGEY